MAIAKKSFDCIHNYGFCINSSPEKEGVIASTEGKTSIAAMLLQRGGVVALQQFVLARCNFN